MRGTIYITGIFSSLLLTGLTFASFAWAAGEPEPSLEDRSSTPGAKKPLTVKPPPDPADNTESASALESGAVGNSAVRMPEITIGGKVTPPARQTDKERYRLPQTTESITKEKIDSTINLANPEDALKYLPSIQVRNRYIGDTNAPVGMRMSGTSAASARNLIYANGILLSSLLGNNNQKTDSPRWNTVSPGEIAQVNVLYGPFSAAYPGNSMGGVINIITRMPEKFEAGADVQSSWQTFNLFGTEDTYDSQRYMGYIGHRYKDLSFRFDYSHLDAHSQPITFPNGSGLSGYCPWR